MQEIEKKSKNHSEIAACEQNTSSEKAIFFQTSVSHCTLKLEQRKFTPQNHSFFSLHFLFWCDQNYYSNLTPKIMKMCEQIFKKRQRPNKIQILLTAKNQEKANNSPSYRCAAINKKTQV